MSDPIECFVILSLISIIIIFCCFYVSHGLLFDEFFFEDSRDTGMDFFHSIEFLKGDDPYFSFFTLYPPLANLLFKLIYHLIPYTVTDLWPDQKVGPVYLRATEFDLRTYQSTMLCFIFYILLTALFLHYFIYKRFSDKKEHIKFGLYISILFSYGFITGIERGNIIVFSVVSLLFFIINYDSEEPASRELSLALLAVSAGMKIYPALYGILMLKEKKWKQSFRTIVYGILFFFLPFFAFKGGAIANFKRWIYILSYVTGTEGSSRADQVARVIWDLTGKIWLIPAHLKIIKMMIMTALIFGIVFADKRHKTAMYISALIYMMTGQSFYLLSFFLSSLLLFFEEEEKIGKENIIYFILLMMLILPVPVFGDDARVLYDTIAILGVTALCCSDILCFLKKI